MTPPAGKAATPAKASKAKELAEHMKSHGKNFRVASCSICQRDFGPMCTHCGSSDHPSSNCPTLNLTRVLTGKTVGPTARLPDEVFIMEVDSVSEAAEGIKNLHKWKAEGR